VRPALSAARVYAVLKIVKMKNVSVDEVTLLTKEQIAIKLNVSAATISRYIQNKQLTPIRIGKRAMFPANTELKPKEPRAKKEVAHV
jgi:hypothetical protein